MRALFIITFIISSTLCFGQATISGYVTDAKNGESLIGVTIYDETTQTGAVTNVYGFYSLTLPSGNHQLRVSYIGYETFSQNLDLQQNQKLDIELEIAVQQMQEVVITSDRYVVEEEVK
ncbi:MAG: carboxypeptidase-like regulatory domain-containing protein, partial [bacterium]|nr:carboxypeptidase-like regulatory domain-containing protein [bacterium]